MVSMLATIPLMPHLTFSEESVEDRTLSLAAGRLVSKSVDMVTIRQPGCKDDVSREAVPWLEALHQNPNWQPEWVERAKSMYRQFKEGLEITQVGTHIRMWPPISKAEAETVMSAGLRTVEELAGANEQVLSRIGMGARALKDKARAWLDSAEKDGRGAAELNVLREQNAQQSAQIAELVAKLNQMLATPAAPAPQVVTPEAVAVEDDFLK